MELIKQNFSIKDLEHLSGVKAHTIRIWEKRYNILNPDRTDTNIRTYDISNLQKILNVTFLTDHGYKISRIAKLKEEDINTMVKDVAASTSPKIRAVNAFKLSMINFDKALFDQTYNSLLETKSFRKIFYEIFLPLLDEIGLLWQTDTLNPVHEHFLVGLIKEKIYLNIALLGNNDDHLEKSLYILFLPENEIHDLGLLFLNYELNFNKRKTIYLGPSLPLKDMKYIVEVYPDLKFVSYLTTAPREISEFIKEFETELCKNSLKELNLFGARIQPMDPSKQPSHIKVYKSITEFTNSLE